MSLWRRGEVGEPASWILAVAAMIVAVGKVWNLVNPRFYTGPYFTGILLGFFVHEVSHRGIARWYGLYSEFRATITGLLVTVATGFIPGIVILAPGYVAVYSWGGGGRRGWIRSVEAGPASNIILALALLASSLVLGGWAGYYLRVMASINAWIAFFNLLPVPPLDGAKIARADPGIWGLLLAVSLALLFYP